MDTEYTLGERLADKLSSIMGSWIFIGTQAFIFALWITINTINPKGMDKYPFVFLNLIVGFESAFTAPILLMAGNRQSEIDRKRLLDDLNIDIKIETMIEGMKDHFEYHFHELQKQYESER